VDLDDGVVDIEQRIGRGVLAATRAEWRTRHRGESGQGDQKPAGDRVELADVAEGERAQERPQRRRSVSAGENPAHPAVP
jgi:hypothetical protein